MSKLLRARKREVVGVILLTHIFNERHMLVDAVCILVGGGAVVTPFSFCFLDSFILETYITLLLVGGYEHNLIPSTYKGLYIGQLKYVILNYTSIISSGEKVTILSKL